MYGHPSVGSFPQQYPSGLYGNASVMRTAPVGYPGPEFARPSAYAGPGGFPYAGPGLYDESMMYPPHMMGPPIVDVTLSTRHAMMLLIVVDGFRVPHEMFHSWRCFACSSISHDGHCIE